MPPVLDERGLLRREHGSQIDHQAILGNSRQHRNALRILHFALAGNGVSEPRFELRRRIFRAGNAQQARGQIFAGSRSSADHGLPFRDFDLGLRRSQRRFQLLGNSPRALADLLGPGPNHAQRRQLIKIVAQIGEQRRFQCGDHQLIQAQSPEQRMFADSPDDFAPAGQNAGLRTAHEFVAAERDQIHSGFDARAHHRFRDALRAEIGQAARTQIFVQRNARALAEIGQFVERGPIGEAHDGEIRAMHAQQQPRAFTDGAFVIRDGSAVRRAHFAQQSAALGHDVRDAKGLADLDQFAARDDHFPASRQRGQRQEDRGRIVVDRAGCLRPGEARQQRAGVNVAPSSRAGGDVVFEICILPGCFADVFDGGFGQRRAAQIRVQNHAGRVDYRPQRRREQQGHISRRSLRPGHCAPQLAWRGPAGSLRAAAPARFWPRRRRVRGPRDSRAPPSAGRTSSSSTEGILRSSSARESRAGSATELMIHAFQHSGPRQGNMGEVDARA